ncbi:MAG: hypothetical protein U9N81_13520 [Bacillota bacterium]|nr:hypothetical protein [Bacillota bacterium]
MTETKARESLVSCVKPTLEACRQAKLDQENDPTTLIKYRR